MSSKLLLVVDGYSLLFRAFYSTSMLTTSDGRPTNALHGFASMLFALIEQHRPDCMVIALDAHEKTFRHEEFEAYKGTRDETPDALVQQLIYSRTFFAGLGIPALELSGFEADDVVGTLSKRAEEQGYRTLIVSGDLDALQLVDHAVTVIAPKRGVSEVAVYDPEAVQERYGFGPEFVPDYKALVGDTSDNIPGVPGIGDKSATKLIQQFGPVEAIMDRIEEVEEKFRKKLLPALDQIPKSKRLATIVRDIPVDFDFAPFRPTQEQIAAAQEMMSSLEFKGHTRKVVTVFSKYLEGRAAEADGDAVEVKEEPLAPKIGSAIDGLSDLMRWVGDRPFSVLFPEEQATNLLDPVTSGAYVSCGGEVRQTEAALAREAFLSRPDRAIGHDVKALYRGSGRLQPPTMDTLIAAYILKPGRAQYPLRGLVQAYLDVAPPESHEQAAMGLELLGPALRTRVEKESQTKILDEVELPLIPILAEMEGLGIAVSKEVLSTFSGELKEEIQKIESVIFEEAQQTFAIGSPKQLGEVLFEKLGLPGGKKSKIGWATGAEILQELTMDYPIARHVLQWRELTKLKNTYADALPRMIGPDGRIHTTLNQTVAATGRLSSNDPNLQNIPIRTELGRHIRQAFHAAPGYELASFDYSQIELRLLAHLCQDDALVEGFRQHVDVHTVTASQMFGIAQDGVTSEQRRLAKMLNYAVLYGVSGFGLAQQLGEGFGVAEARELIKQYFERFPKVKRFTDSVVEEARSKGFTATLLGRRRYFPEIHSSNRTERQYAERQAMNAPIQGAAADLVKRAMIDVRRADVSRDVRMLLQVHDELVFELADPSLTIIESIRGHMEQAMPIDVPITVDAKIGKNWDQMTKIAIP